MVLYDLSKIENITMNHLYDGSDKSIEDKLKLKNITYKLKESEKEYNILKYDKTYLTKDRYGTVGIFRSVVIDKGNIVCFSPPKSLAGALFHEKHKEMDGCYGEEFVEGTMINVFFDNDLDDWEISTKSTIGGRNVFFRDGEVTYEKTFRYMFLDAASHCNLEFDDLNKDYCYSFVMQHPENRIVTQFNEKRIYLIECYKIDNSALAVELVERDNIKNCFSNSSILFPRVYDKQTTMNMKVDMYLGVVDYSVMGIVVKHKDSGDRMKVRNPNYEYVRTLKGNQPKLQYQYIVLRKEGKVNEYLKYFPESAERFLNFREQIHIFTQQLYENYRLCYIKKTKPLIQYPENLRTHMYLLHQDYLNDLKDKNGYINRQYVIQYINNLHPSQLMFSINFSMRKRKIDKPIVDGV